MPKTRRPAAPHLPHAARLSKTSGGSRLRKLSAEERARRDRLHLQHVPPVTCGALAGLDLPCEKPAGHPGGHLAIVKLSPAERLAHALEDHTRALRHEAFMRRARAARNRVDATRQAQQPRRRPGRKPGVSDTEWRLFAADNHEAYQLGPKELATRLSAHLARDISPDVADNTRRRNPEK